MKVTKIIPLLGLLFLTAACQSMTTVRQSPDFNQAAIKHSQIAVLPPDAEVNLISFGGGKERMHDYESHMEDLIGEAITEHLKEKGYRVTNITRRKSHESGIAGQALRVKDANQEVLQEVYKDLFMNKEQALAINKSIGPKRIDFKDGSNLILVTRYFLVSKTSGARTADFIMNLMINSGSFGIGEAGKVVVSLYDNKTGKLLWSDTSSYANDNFNGAIESLSSQEEVDRAKAKFIARSVLTELVKEGKE